MTKRTTIQAALPQIKPATLRTFHMRLADWYARHGRHDLPWRQTADPYAIWISEIMLQQTQVATVRARFYAPFLATFPTVEALAAAPQEAVLKAWEGLGYYSRARNLHKAAQQVVSSGWWGVSSDSAPLATHYSLLTSLPGIGRNTAHAILAFGYHQPVAILEANVKRVVARVFALTTPSDAELWAGAEMLLNRAAPFDYNQAMMDVGSLVCTPKQPACDRCPANAICAGKANPTAYPAPRAKKQIPVRAVTILVREDANGRLFLAPRDVALLGGLYGFEQMERSRESLVVSLQDASCANDSRLTTHDSLGTVTHTYSHFKLIGHVVYQRLPEKMNAPHWHSRTEIAALPLSTLDHKILALVDKCHSGKKKSIKAAAKIRKR